MPDRYRRLIRRLGHTSWFARVGRAAAPLDRLIQQRSGGRLTILGGQLLPQLLLTTTGRSSGLARTVPLLYVELDGGFVTVASNWGQRSHPAWSANLLADPAATVEVNGLRVPVKAQLLDGAERDRMWLELTRIWPAYRTYAARSGRDLRIFLLRDTRR